MGGTGRRPAQRGGRSGMPGGRSGRQAVQRCAPRSRRDGCIGASIPAPRSEMAIVTSAAGTPLVLGSFRLARQSTRRRLGVLDLPTRDRACLRILLRAKVATTAHLTTLVYRRRQTTQLRLMRLWQAGFIERTQLPPLTRGGAPLVFRLSRRGRARLGYRPLKRAEAGMQLRHDLHVIDAVCALARPDAGDPNRYPLAAWCTPAMSGRFIEGVIPDALLALQLDTGGAVLALEVDEGTEHAPVIRAKLARYAKALDGRDAWHVVFVVGEPQRGGWIRRLARDGDELGHAAGQAWVTFIDELRERGTQARIASLRGSAPRRLGDLSWHAGRRHVLSPVGSEEWLRLMGSGAGEDLREVFGSR